MFISLCGFQALDQIYLLEGSIETKMPLEMKG